MDELELNIGDKIELNGDIYQIDRVFDSQTIGIIMVQTREGIPQTRCDGARTIRAIQLLNAKKIQQ